MSMILMPSYGLMESSPRWSALFYERARNKVGLLKLRAMYKAENWPDWVDQNDDEALCPIVGKPEDIHIVVTGGPGKHSALIPTFGTPKAVNPKIVQNFSPSGAGAPSSLEA